ncbi:hypothetical protein GCM10011360_07570 [Primorskyibacter flagellatus]|uniref:VPLPA-CTERM protein sorting domain-containing protein n=1 Tax=Primorskyibacter flagellatus TaxID=1387277 RepID=A0A917A1U1_9RHOB|nr:VPLPA-CTERM sorting domain-containing protein [Primorskyibacter flagellatus]GGE21424.1 hypothetical protein GCM10011360_07570 [Primorskyibacter flagellatus]
MKAFIRATLAALSLAVSIAPATAATVTLTSVDNGWIDHTGSLDTVVATNSSILAGVSIAQNRRFANWVLFDLDQITGTSVTAATLIYRGGNGEVIKNGNFTLNFYLAAVRPDTATKLATRTGGIDVYNDVNFENAAAGAGTYTDRPFGLAAEITDPVQTPMPEISITLNSLGRFDITQTMTGTDRYFAFGGSVFATASGTYGLWSSSGGLGAATLILEGPDLAYAVTTGAVPLPASLPLLLAGVGGLAVLRRRRA